jgi:hypothetical protein
MRGSFRPPDAGIELIAEELVLGILHTKDVGPENGQGTTHSRKLVPQAGIYERQPIGRVGAQRGATNLTLRCRRLPKSLVLMFLEENRLANTAEARHDNAGPAWSFNSVS